MAVTDITPTIRFDPIIGLLDLSHRGVVSLKRQHHYNSAAATTPESLSIITVESLPTILQSVGLAPRRVNRLSVARCCLCDDDLIALSQTVIEHLGSIEVVDVRDNWFLYTYGPTPDHPLDHTNPVYKAVRRMLRWNIQLLVSGTNLASKAFMGLFPECERELLVVN